MTVTDIVNPKEFRVPATDTKGHNVRVWFRAQPGHAHQMETIVQSKKFPYRTKGDLLRHALLRHLRWLESQEALPSVTAAVDSILDIMRDEEFASEFQLVWAKLSERIAMHLGNGSAGEARRLLLEVKRHIVAMPDCYWRDAYLKELETRYGYLLKDAPKASLLKFEVD